VVLLFLGNLRSTIIAAVPFQVDRRHLRADVGRGLHVNTITLLALALAVGIVIDDAIVVLENIHRFIHEKGYKPFPARSWRPRDRLAVLATTLSLVAVFLPVAFMGASVWPILEKLWPYQWRSR